MRTEQRRRRAGPWAARTFKFAGYQLVAQVFGFATGILVVRALTKTDYAYYSIAVALIAAATLVADSGVGAVLMSKGASFLQDRRRLAGLIADALRFRGRISIGILPVVAALVMALLLLNGASAPFALLVAGLVLIGLAPVFVLGVAQGFHRLELHLTLLQRSTVLIAGIRLALVLALWVVGVASVPWLLVVNAACSIIHAGILVVFARRDVDIRGADRGDLRDFSTAAARTMPMLVLLVAGEQWYLFVLSIRADSAVLAESSAMSRFAVVYLVFAAFVTDVAAPLLARTPSVRSLVVRRTLAVLGAYLALGVVVVALTSVFATPLLVLLGTQYAGLETALVVFAAAHALAYVGHAFETLNRSRGWLRYSWVYAPLVAAWAVAGLFVDVSRIDLAGWYFFSLSVAMLITQIVRFVEGARTLPPVRGEHRA